MTRRIGITVLLAGLLLMGSNNTHAEEYTFLSKEFQETTQSIRPETFFSSEIPFPRPSTKFRTIEKGNTGQIMLTVTLKP